MATGHDSPEARHNIRPHDSKFRELILVVSEWCQADEKFGAIKLNDYRLESR